MPSKAKGWMELPVPIAQFDEGGTLVVHNQAWGRFVNQYVPQFSNVDPFLFLNKFCNSINEPVESFIKKMLADSESETFHSFQFELSSIHFVIDKNKTIWVYFSKNSQSEFSNQLTQEIIENERQKALAELAGSIAHEVNNPMTVIYTKLQMLKVKLSSGDLPLDKLEDSIDSMTRNTERVVKIIRGMRSLASFGNRSGFVKSNICEIVEEALVLLASELMTSGVVVKKGYALEGIDIFVNPLKFCSS